MADAATPRQVLYAMVAAGFHLVVGVLAVASAPLAPTWWTVAAGVFWVVVSAIIGLRWRHTGLVLGLSMLGFVAWTVGAVFLFT